MELTVPDEFHDLWWQLPSDVQARLFQMAQEWFVTYLKLIRDGVKAPERGGQPCAG
jgi:hypothetical protein